MTRDVRFARIWFGLTAVVVAIAVVVQMRATLRLDEGFFDNDLKRVLNIFVFFTVQSNLLVGVTSGLLAARFDRVSTAFRALYLAALLDITVTGVVFQIALADLDQLQGKAAAADFLLHKAVPILAVLGWLLFGPRGLFDRRIIPLAAAVPVAWVAFTLARAPFASDFYPYPFVDVTDLGYPRVVLNLVVITAFFFGLAAGAVALDRRLPTGRVPSRP
ncbi:Pr6Pr family membrane protein [Actinospongicola halichondriae]|uniref:Pr6Pr family membrane protein n=1 Tax=Actinospongicola halichondriae TaxID=3236844 RepID=UPI003D50752A